MGQRDHGPNVRRAESLTADPNPEAVAELVDVLGSDSVALIGDATKALYELAVRDPAQVAPHTDAVAALLHSPINRLVWGGVTVLHAISEHAPEALIPLVGPLIEAVDSGSVITQDHGVGALAATGDPAALDYALNHLRSCDAGHVPLRSEHVAPYVGDRTQEFHDIVESRLAEQSPGGARRIRTMLRDLP